jgi:hypothetical protein
MDKEVQKMLSGIDYTKEAEVEEEVVENTGETIDEATDENE